MTTTMTKTMAAELIHLRAGTGAMLVETREERRHLLDMLESLPESAEVRYLAAPTGGITDARTGRPTNANGLQGAYDWASSGPGRVLVVYDWHVIANNPMHWRLLIDTLPRLRQPKGSGEGTPASLVVFVAPMWDLQPQNPLRGLLPVVHFAPPTRDGLREIADRLKPLNGEAEPVLDALSGLGAESAEQVCAEVLVSTSGRYDAAMIRARSHQALREAGLEIWKTSTEIGGLSGLRDYVQQQVVPYLRHSIPQLRVRRVLFGGVQGMGKSYGGTWLASQVECDCVSLSMSSLKRGVVGGSETALRQALLAISTRAAESPLVVMLDEIDKLASEGLDGGTSSGMFSQLLTWLENDRSQAIIVATANYIEKMDVALMDRFQARFFFDLPTRTERNAVSRIHLQAMGCRPENLETAAVTIAEASDGYSFRQLSQDIIPSVVRLSNGECDPLTIGRVLSETVPTSVSKADQIAAIRKAASQLRRANDPEDGHSGFGRQVN